MEYAKIVIDFLMLLVAGTALWYARKEYLGQKIKENHKLFSQLNRRYEMNNNIQTVVKYLRDIEPSDEKPTLYQVEMFLRFFEELGIYTKTNSLDKKELFDFFGFYLKQLYTTERGKQLLKPLKGEDMELSLLLEFKPFFDERK